MNALLTQLKVLSKCQQGDKIATQESVFSIDTGTTMQGLYRKYKGETRDRNVHCIFQVVSDVIELVRESIECDPGNAKDGHVGMTIQRGVNALAASREGIQNLSLTYQQDARTVSQFATVLDQIDDFLAESSHYVVPEVPAK